MKFRSLSEARVELGTLVRLAERGESVVIGRQGKPAVWLVPVTAEDFILSARDADRLNAWADRERPSGRTRTYSSVSALVSKARPKSKKRRS